MVEGDCVNENLIDDRKSGAIKLQIVPAQPKTLSHLPTRPPVDLAFHDLVYSVREGRRNRKFFPILFFFLLFPFFSAYKIQVIDRMHTSYFFLVDQHEFY